MTTPTGILALVASTVFVLAGCAADASEDTPSEDDAEVSDVNEALATSYTGFFHSPTGKNYCDIATYDRVDIVRCEWRGGGDHAMLLAETGPARKIHITDTVYAPTARTLQYGDVIKHGDLRCTVRPTSGITCKSVKSRHGFTMSVDKQTTF